MSAQDKMCSDIYQNDLTLVEIYAITLNSGSDMCQIKVGQHQKCLMSNLFHALMYIHYSYAFSECTIHVMYSDGNVHFMMTLIVFKVLYLQHKRNTSFVTAVNTGTVII